MRSLHTVVGWSSDHVEHIGYMHVSRGSTGSQGYWQGHLVCLVVETLLESCSRTPWYQTQCSTHWLRLLGFATITNVIMVQRLSLLWMFVVVVDIWIVWLTPSNVTGILNVCNQPFTRGHSAPAASLALHQSEHDLASLSDWGQPIRWRRLCCEAEMLSAGHVGTLGDTEQWSLHA